MSVKPAEILKAYFKTGSIPTEEHFGNLIDSISNLIEGGDVSRTNGCVTITHRGNLVEIFIKNTIDNKGFIIINAWVDDSYTKAIATSYVEAAMISQHMSIITLNQLQAIPYTTLISYGNKIINILCNTFDTYTVQLEEICHAIRDSCFTVQ